MLRAYLSKNLFELGNIKPEVARNSPLPGAKGQSFYREDVEARQENI